MGYQWWYLPGVVALFAASPSAVTFMKIWEEKTGLALDFTDFFIHEI